MPDKAKSASGPSQSQIDAAGSKPPTTDEDPASPTKKKEDAPGMNKSWYGWPVEEVDPLAYGDTFCIIAKKFRKKHYIHRFSTSKALFLFGPVNPVRKLAIYITTHRFFDILIVLAILLNCITLAMAFNDFDIHKPNERVEPWWDYYTDMIEFGFLALFCLELVLKVISKGFVFNKFSYLRSGWNILDCIVVTSGICTAVVLALKLGGDEYLAYLRTLRVFRVIKIVSILPGLRMMINALLSSARRLLEVMGLMILCLIVFALFAVELFQSSLRQKCVKDKGGDADPDESHTPLASVTNKDDRDKMWTEWVSDWKNWLDRDFPNAEPTQCGNGSWARLCPPGWTCLSLIGENPDDGWTSFDAIHKALLSTFQLMTADYWERVYDVVLSTNGIFCLFFFVPIIFLGSYYLLNLLLAVVTLSYEDEALNSAEEKTVMSVEDRLGLNRKKSTFSFDQMSALNIAKLNAHRPRTKSETAGLRELRATEMEGENGEDEEANPDQSEKPRMNVAVMLAIGKRKGSISEGNRNGMELNNGFTTSAPSKQSLGGDSNASEPDLDGYEEIKYRKEPNPCHVKRRRVFACLSKTLQPVVNSKYFEWVITICIILNTICLAVEHHGETALQDDILKIFNYVFIGIFAAECILKLLALQLSYFSSGWNIFDFIVVIVSFVNLFLTEILRRVLGNQAPALSVFRSFRLLRVFRLAQSWITMKVLLNIVFASFGSLGNLVLLLMIVIYIFAVIGIQVVGRGYSPGAFEAVNRPLSYPRWHWQNFIYAFMMVFRVLCGEWIEPLWDCLQAQKHYSNNAIPPEPEEWGYAKCFLIYLPTLIVGNFIVLNLFLALLLNSFDTEQLNAQREKELEASGRAQQMKNLVGIMLQHQDDKEGDDMDDDTLDTRASIDASVEPTSGSNTHNKLHHDPPLRKFKKFVNRIIVQRRVEQAEMAITRATNRRKAIGKPLSNKMFLSNPATRNSIGLQDQTPDSSEASKELYEPGACCPTCKCCACCKCCERSRFGCCCRTGIYARKPYGHQDCVVTLAFRRCRIWSVIVVSHPIFEYTILFLIFASSILLCFEDNELDNKPELKLALCWLNYIFTALFVIEMILKWLAIGLYRYFTSFWTILDGFIVIVSLIPLMFEISVGDVCSSSPTQSDWQDNFDALKVLRTLRALRPLRAISRWRGMKIVVNALIHAIPSIINVILVCVIFWLIFAILGVQLFKGGFYRCVDSEGDMVDHHLVPNREVCCAKAETHDYSWINQISNFDNVAEAYLSLFQIATFEGWMELMSFSVDYVGVDKQPQKDKMIWYYLFYVIFIIFGSFFSLQLFISVIVDNFSVLKKKYEGGILEVLFTPHQRSYYIAMKNVGKRVPQKMIPKPKWKYLQFFYHVGSGKRLETFIMIMITLNLCVEAASNSIDFVYCEHILAAASSCFTVLYLSEAVIKLLGLRHYYFTIPWNIYDFIICIASLVVTFLPHDYSESFPLPPGILRVVRVFRLGRILRSVKPAKGFRKLMVAFSSSIPALFNIGALLMLVTFMYAILGMALFGEAPNKWAIDDVFNFGTFITAVLMLFRLMTVAGWNEVLDSLTVQNSVCGKYRHLECGRPGEPECPNRYFVILYIVSYLMLTNQILMNLFVAIILENYVEASNEEDVGIVDEDFEMFYVHWARYDPFATQFIQFDELSDFLDGLDPPFQMKKPNMVAIVAFNLPIARGDRIHCLDVLHELLTYSLGKVEESPEFRKVQNRMERKFQKRFPNRRLLDIVSTTRRWKIQQNAAITLQRAWRAFVARKKQQARAAAMGKEHDTITESSHSQRSRTKTKRGGIGSMFHRMDQD